MSTRGRVVVLGHEGFYRRDYTAYLYKASDAYPSNALREIFGALNTLSFMVEREKEDRHKFKLADRETHFSVSGLAALLCAESVSVHGAFTSIEEIKEGYLTQSYWPEDGFWIEWAYVIDLKRREILVRHKLHGKNVDPESYANQMREDWKEETRAVIRAQVSKIEALGFKVNPVRRSKAGGAA